MATNVCAPQLIVRLCWALVLSIVPGATFAADASAQQRLPAIRTFLNAHCTGCHAGAEAEGGLDLAAISFDLSSAAQQTRWVRVFDRVRDGEMPPRDAPPLPAPQRQAFLQATGDWLRAFYQHDHALNGRVRARRLTRRELERSLQDLLGIDIPLADLLSEEPASNEFSTVADGQSMSHFQLAQHLAAVDLALDEAYRRAFTSEDRYERDFDARGVSRSNERSRTREPELREGRAVTWSSDLSFYGRVPATTAPESGWYRFTVTAGGVKLPTTGGVWTTVRSGLCVSSAPLLSWITAFEAGSDAKEITFEAWLPRGHMLEIRPGDTTLKKARFAGGQVGTGEGEPQDVPGVAIDRITMQRIHRGPDDAGVRRLLFDDLTLDPEADAQRRNEAGDRRRTDRIHSNRLVSSSPQADAVRLVERFARRAFRRPVTPAELAGYVSMVRESLGETGDLAQALRIGYRAILCSPRFLYLTEAPGPLDDHAIAARLSYFLTGSTPDARLTELAEAQRLQNPDVRREETERLLASDSGRRFLRDFAAEWLDLDQIDFTEPDAKLYPEFDAIVQHSMLAETHTYLETMLRENLSVTALIDSDFTFLNSRLARFYDIDGVAGDELRRVTLKPEHRRGGVLTQGAILKVTANGSNTSPVVRGVWLSERLLGVPIPPPPGNVPAIEPDIRGARTIRDMLAKHRSQDSCASCHVKIDPPGFALENYDPAGRWRERYIILDGGRRVPGPTVDASYTYPDGKEFRDVTDFRKLIAAEPEKVARCVTEKLLVYATGAPMSFSDREAVDQIVAAAAAEGYRFRSLVHAVTNSKVFLSK